MDEPGEISPSSLLFSIPVEDIGETSSICKPEESLEQEICKIVMELNLFHNLQMRWRLIPSREEKVNREHYILSVRATVKRDPSSLVELSESFSLTKDVEDSVLIPLVVKKRVGWIKQRYAVVPKQETLEFCREMLEKNSDFSIASLVISDPGALNFGKYNPRLVDKIEMEKDQISPFGTLEIINISSMDLTDVNYDLSFQMIDKDILPNIELIRSFFSQLKQLL